MKKKDMKTTKIEDIDMLFDEGKDVSAYFDDTFARHPNWDHIYVEFPPEEKARVIQAAKKTGLPITTFVRKAVAEAIKN
ncbi:hypothetical protein FACS189467_9110 [Bacteroidia bacterium]|nr:hypothetical protein FACS189467_9110 [Bacteroidia bacterium]